MRSAVLFLAAAAFAGAAEIPTPPPEHPRLYFRAPDLEVIRARRDHPNLKKAWDRLRADAAAPSENVSVARAAASARSKALLYAVDGDRATGRAAIDTMLRILPVASWDLSIQDISREIGLVMVSGAMVYDWCYGLLAPEEKTALIDQFERLAKLLEVGYPPVRQSSITSHTGEAMLMRDLFGTGIAIYDEKPYMYNVGAERIFAELIPARNFFYPAHAHHQGNGYGPYRFRWEIQLAWMLKRLTGNDYFTAAMRQVPYNWHYRRRPDGIALPYGDYTTSSPTVPYMLTASYFRDPILQALARSGSGSIDPIEEICFSDPALEPADPNALPLTRFFNSPLSSVIARTSWTGEPVIVEMKAPEYRFNNHQHLDSGAFQIYYRGPLAIDSGLYRKYGSDHDRAYYKRTVAHNAMLVCDPTEQFTTRGDVNDCGQRWPNNGSEPRDLKTLLERGYRVGSVLARRAGPGYTYFEADIAAAYSAKVKSYTRAFVFLSHAEKTAPATLVVLDRIAGSSPKRWLLHSIGEPGVDGAAAVVRNNGGKLVNRTLLPAAAKIEKVGGAGREYTVGGVNYPPLSVRPGDEGGAWRIEVSSAEPSESDLFLNVLQVMDETAEPAAVARIDAEHVTGARIRNQVVLFPKSSGPLDRSFTFANETHATCIVTGLANLSWRAGAITLRPEDGVLQFPCKKGRLTLTPVQ